MLFQLRDPFLESPPSSSQLELPRVCPPSLAWCLQLWSHPTQPRSASPGIPSPVMGSQWWLPWPFHPESQNAFLRSDPAQLLPLLVAYSPDHQMPPRKSLQLAQGSSTPSPTATCHGQHAQPGDMMAAG
ncbi:unnamed protein product [Rangifer tarandus platyrhynchus]|uniref:Uncharacterized protein n=1 Tax=Rangifer tarandus platyrhynchus TaxID=3082113 RepID=A0AC59ZFH4_RANTA